MMGFIALVNAQTTATNAPGGVVVLFSFRFYQTTTVPIRECA